MEPKTTPVNSLASDQTIEDDDRVDWRLWFKWALANAVGQALGASFGCMAIWCLTSVYMGIGESAYFFLALAAFGAVTGTVVGAIQAVILREKGVAGFEWVLASAAGGAIGWTIVALMFWFGPFFRNSWD